MRRFALVKVGTPCRGSTCAAGPLGTQREWGDRLSTLESATEWQEGIPMATVKDPVCGMEIDDATALHADHDGVTYYFCSEGCRNTFLANPSEYVS